MCVRRAKKSVPDRLLPGRGPRGVWEWTFGCHRDSGAEVASFPGSPSARGKALRPFPRRGPRRRAGVRTWGGRWLKAAP